MVSAKVPFNPHKAMAMIQALRGQKGAMPEASGGAAPHPEQPGVNARALPPPTGGAQVNPRVRKLPPMPGLPGGY